MLARTLHLNHRISLAPTARRPQRQLRGTARPALKTYSFVTAAVGIVDICALTVLLHVFVIAAAGLAPQAGIGDNLVFTALGLLAAAAIGRGRGLYDVIKMGDPAAATMRAITPLACALAADSAAVVSAGMPARVALPLTFVAFCVGGAYLAGSRGLWARLVNYGIQSGRLCYRVAVVGGDSARVAAVLAAARTPFVTVTGTFDSTAPRAEDPVGCFQELLARTRRERVDAIVLAYPRYDIERLETAFGLLRSSVADIFLWSDLARCGMLPGGHPLTSLPVLPVQRTALTDIDTALKGIFDRVAGALLLAFVSPLLALTALAIKLESPGPVFFMQPRVGYNNALFTMFKFRSMYSDMTDRTAKVQTTRNDPRVTRVGRFIRRFSIDELPQLLNVIRGEMSLVGPRPHAPGTNVEGLLVEHATAGYPLRHRVLPGITGWAQINGSRGVLRTPEQIRERVKLDLYYIDHWSLWLDLKILVLTAVREIVSRSAF